MGVDRTTLTTLINIEETSQRAKRAGLAGDIITALTGKSFYITSSRYRSMATDYVTPMDRTYALLGQPTISLQQGIDETVSWLLTQPEYQSATLPPSPT